MHFLVLGATGAIRRQFCDLALNEGHKLTLFVRNATKVPENILNNAEQVIEGSFEAHSDLDKIAKCGADMFVSFAGPTFGASGTPLADGYELLIPKLASQNMTRVLILCTPSFRDKSDVETFKWRFGGWFMKFFSPGQYQEMIAIGETVSTSSEEIQWELFRVGGLTNGDEAPVEATHLGSGLDKTWISRSSVARWVLDEAIEGKWVGKMPYICNK
ncbi:hypothetical protein N7499_009535 [Penicillium canescens]|uniref:NAD(P)-binding domain-containing protein n=1 Tax=Penicillium canescens TaxID=5083 RepID=A0AAD6INC6_PENCN|nr:uncharacterized protein N7446_008439 [Penicillium canescens]KAJ6019301.1 hypothetical protein N7522_001368 [Penicillium canescens]KAJ6033270.1 hypothetical protein N7444_011041 [Penicillium canescens]KAJ6057540.1 hypothetical protein N7460_000814 [Penicillium canescens]KAJ6058856.1 hypothetical protein N7446_008439 [Penicillium canescens]KAJ6071521.1 hypothetical protein N7499_009535 [Penicillium canescens]